MPSAVPEVDDASRPRPSPSRHVVTDPAAVAEAAAALASGSVVAHAFANFYAITTRADEAIVHRVNAMKGRPLAQVGSIVAPPTAVVDAWDLARLPARVSRRAALELVDAFFGLGPFGFRGPARAGLPAHLTAVDAGVLTAQVIGPGYACPSNRFLSRSLAVTGDDHLYVTSANRSHHLTGADDSPAHWRADGLVAEFGDFPGFVLLEHEDEEAARRRLPGYLPMSTTILALHRVAEVPDDPRPHLTLERHGSLPAEEVRTVLAELGFGLVLGPRATRRLQPRDYTAALSDRRRADAPATV